MRSLLAKRWFLLLLLAGLTLASLHPEWLKPVTVWLEPRIIVAIALFLMAVGLESRSLLQAVTHPLPVLWAFLLSYSALPALAWSAGGLLPVADLRLGLLIIASVPCTLASAVLWTRMAGGNEATTLLAVLLTTATSCLVTPAWLALAAYTDVVLDTPGMMRNLALILIVPVGLGQLSRTIGSLVQIVDRHKVILGAVSRLFIFSIILKAAVDVSDRLRATSTPPTIGWMAVAAILCIAIHLAALAGGFWTSRLLRFNRADQIAVALACSQKTLPVSLYLFDSYFKESFPLAVVPLVSYHVGQLVVDTVIADVLARPRK
jgi:solute carrier family 10 (sodium/bile acid cotransporter), member 7